MFAFRATRSSVTAGMFVSTLIAGGTAQASGFATARFGGEHGHPTTSNATALYYNPAGIAESTGTHLFADGLFALHYASYERSAAPSDAPEPAGSEGANTGKATLLDFIVLPMLGATTRVGPLALGVAAYAPFGGSEHWAQNSKFSGSSYPGPVDGVQRWYSIQGQIRSIYLTAGAAWQFAGTGLSLGASVSAIRSSVETITARTVLGDNDVEHEGRSQIDGSGWQAGFGLGALYQAISEKLWFGASYQSRPNVRGGMGLAGTLRNSFLGNVTPTAIDFHQDLPDIYRLGARYRVSPVVELRLFGDWTRWSSLENQCISRRGEPCDVAPDGSAPAGSGALQNIRRDWRDSFGVRAGASYWTTPGAELFGGVGYDSKAVPDTTLETSFMDYDTFLATIGARLRLMDSMYLAGSYLNFFEIPRDTSGQNIHATLKSPSKGPDSGGRYSEWIGALNVNVELVF